MAEHSDREWNRMRRALSGEAGVDVGDSGVRRYWRSQRYRNEDREAGQRREAARSAFRQSEAASYGATHSVNGNAATKKPPY